MSTHLAKSSSEGSASAEYSSRSTSSGELLLGGNPPTGIRFGKAAATRAARRWSLWLTARDDNAQDLMFSLPSGYPGSRLNSEVKSSRRIWLNTEAQSSLRRPSPRAATIVTLWSVPEGLPAAGTTSNCQ
eukprot:524189-Rhodomonas_salina.2